MSAQLSGSLRHTHSRISEFAEEIAFLGGEQTEKMLLEREYASVVQHENHVLSRRWWFGCVEEGVIKWLWGSFGVNSISYTLTCSLMPPNSLFSAPFLSSLKSPEPESIWEVERKVRYFSPRSVALG